MFPARAARRSAIGSTPSSGEAECLAILADNDQRRLGLTYAQVARALETRAPVAASVATVLDAISGTYVTKTGSGVSATYKLTRAGQKRARRGRPRTIAGVSQA